jgi:hypothetical protein
LTITINGFLKTWIPADAGMTVIQRQWLFMETAVKQPTQVEVGAANPGIAARAGLFCRGSLCSLRPVWVAVFRIIRLMNDPGLWEPL